MKKKNLILTVLTVLGIAVVVSGCGIMSSHVRTSGAGQGIKTATVKLGESEISLISLYGNPTRIIQPNNKETVLLYCVAKTTRSHFLFNLVNSKNVHNFCKSFYFSKGKLVKVKDGAAVSR